MNFSKKPDSDDLGHLAEYWIVSAYRGTFLHVLRLGVGDLVELGCGSQHRPTEPHRVSLHFVRHDLDLDRLRLNIMVGEFRLNTRRKLKGRFWLKFEQENEG